jgi:hypothetical protein
MSRPCHFLILFAGCFLVLVSHGKSLRELSIGRSEFGYRFSGGVDAKVAGIDHDAAYHSIFLGYRLPFRPFGKDLSRVTWDTSFDLSVLSSDGASLAGSRMGLRTGAGYEYLILQQWLLKLDLGINLAKVSTKSRATTLPEQSSWAFGGHMEASVFYSPHPRFAAFMGFGLESFGSQDFADVGIDSGASPTFSTGIVFPW